VTTRIPLSSGMVQSLEPTLGTDRERYWLALSAVPQSVEVERTGPGLVQSIRFHYPDGEMAGKGAQAVSLDQRTDPEVDVLFSDPNGKVVAVQCKSPADAPALERIADRLNARAAVERAIALQLSLLMTARVLKVWADRFAGTGGSGRPVERPQPGDAKMLVTKMFDQGELVIELVQPYVPDPTTGDLTETGRWMALIHSGPISWFSGGPLLDPSTRRTALFDTKEAAFKAAIDFAKTRGLREI
jgi:hypothetical protein